MWYGPGMSQCDGLTTALAVTAATIISCGLHDDIGTRIGHFGSHFFIQDLESRAMLPP